MIGLYLVAKLQGSSSPYFESQFLSVIQALEAYHNIQRPGRLMTEEEYKEIWNAVKLATASELHELIGVAIKLYPTSEASPTPN